MTQTAYIQTFGCQMNEHDSARMRAILDAQGYGEAASPEDASVVVINTCSVRANPENKVYSLLGRLRSVKKRNPAAIIAVAGCVAQQEGQAILEREPSVDIVFGPDHLFALPDLLDEAGKGNRVVMTDWVKAGEDRVSEFIPGDWLEQGRVDGCKAYVAIMKGCDNFCAFCIVPHTRGREASRPPASVLTEVRDLVGKGAKEVWLLGQNVNSYRAEGWGFLELLDAASQTPGLERLRFTSPHPKDWDAALTDLMAARATICNHLHLPFQSGSDRILEKMRRRHTRAELLEQLHYLRKTIPSVEVTTDLIVGFPGETEADLEQTLDVVRQARFAQIFAFKYSPRPGTAAAQWEDDVPKEVKEARLERILTLQDELNAEMLEAYAGRLEKVLIDAPHPRDPGAMNGRTEGHRPVKVAGAGWSVGDLVWTRISGYSGHWLEAEPLERRHESASTP